MKLAATALALALATEVGLLMLGFHGVWREYFPESVGSALWFFFHLPLILLLAPLGLDYPLSGVGHVIVFVLNVGWMSWVYYLILRAGLRRFAKATRESTTNETTA